VGRLQVFFFESILRVSDRVRVSVRVRVMLRFGLG
jgi:hypothetical protein